MRNSRRLGWYLISFILVVYCSFPTQNHYWDGVGFALAIEDSPGLTRALFNPNHLFYNFFGYLIYHSVHWLVPGLRALDILSTLSILLSVCSVYLLYSMLIMTIRDHYYSICLTLLFAFSATWWKFSTDANAYVPSVFFLMLAAYKLKTQASPNWVSIGLIHALSMLLHQIAIFFSPAVLVSIFRVSRRRSATASLRDALVYTAVASGTVILSYCWAWFWVLKGGGFYAFAQWVLSHGREEFSFRSVGHNGWETLRSSTRLFFGGRLSFVLSHVELPVLVMLGILLLCSVSLLAFTLRNALKGSKTRWKRALIQDFSLDGEVLFLLCWMGSFMVFLFLWLTEYPYYRLFYLPAFILSLGVVLKRQRNSGEGEHSYGLASFVVVMVLVNFTFLIYPYSRTKATPPLYLAIGANKVWSDDVIFFSEFNCDNWIFKYFNKTTTWKPISHPRKSWGGEFIFSNPLSSNSLRPVTLQDLKALLDELQYLNSQGKKTWIDATTQDEIGQSEELRDWFAQQVNLTASYGLTNTKHHIRFSLVVPNSTPEMAD